MSLQKEFDATSLEGQQQILQAMFAVLTARGDSFLLDAFIRKMAQTLRLDEGLIRSEATRYIKKNHSKMYVPQPRREETVSDKSTEKQAILEEGFLRYCLHYRKSPADWDEMKDFPYADPFCAKVAKAIDEAAETGAWDEKRIESYLSPEDAENFAKFIMKEEYIGTMPEEEYVRPLHLSRLQAEYKEHTERAESLASTDPEASKEEMRICIRLNREIRSLSNR